MQQRKARREDLGDELSSLALATKEEVCILNLVALRPLVWLRGELVIGRFVHRAPGRVVLTRSRSRSRNISPCSSIVAMPIRNAAVLTLSQMLNSICRYRSSISLSGGSCTAYRKSMGNSDGFCSKT